MIGVVIGVGAALILIGGAAAHARTPSPAVGHSVGLSTRASAHDVTGYLRSLGIDPRGVVVQRGARNYAGPSCPGRGWTCTTARRVVQLSASGTNTFTCTGAATPGNACTIVQSSAHGTNTAKCAQSMVASVPDALTQQCAVVQSSDSGKNSATVSQVSQQGGSCAGTNGQSQTVSQSATVLQQNRTGSNAVSLSQLAGQCATTATTGAASQTQRTDQFFQIEQGGPGYDPASPSSCPGASGQNAAVASQSQHQDGSASSATSGSQSQDAELEGHVDQCSTGVSTYQATQTEDQRLAPNASVAQTQIGPTRFGRGGHGPGAGAAKRTLAKSICCSFQGTNAADRCTIVQSTSQQGPTAIQVEDLTARGSSTGSCTSHVSATQNGLTSATGSSGGQTADAKLLCTSGACATAPVATTVAYTGATSGQFGDPVTLSGRLTRNDTSAPIAGQTVSFAVGSQGCSAPTDGNGVASCTVTLAQPPQQTTVAGSYTSPGGAFLSSASTPVPFTIAPEVATPAFTLQPPPTITAGGTVSLEAAAVDDDGNTVPTGTPIVFTVGGSACSGQIGVVATCAVPSTATGHVTITVDFPAGGSYVSSGGPVQSNPIPEVK